MPTFVPIWDTNKVMGYVNADAITLFNPCGNHVIALINTLDTTFVCCPDSFKDMTKRLGIPIHVKGCPWMSS
jgi:hypothetical protein